MVPTLEFEAKTYYLAIFLSMVNCMKMKEVALGRESVPSAPSPLDPPMEFYCQYYNENGLIVDCSTGVIDLGFSARDRSLKPSMTRVEVA